jgi:hypothetical protein
LQFGFIFFSFIKDDFISIIDGTLSMGCKKQEARAKAGQPELAQDQQALRLRSQSMAGQN